MTQLTDKEARQVVGALCAAAERFRSFGPGAAKYALLAHRAGKALDLMMTGYNRGHR